MLRAPAAHGVSSSSPVSKTCDFALKQSECTRPLVHHEVNEDHINRILISERSRIENSKKRLSTDVQTMQSCCRWQQQRNHFRTQVVRA